MKRNFSGETGSEYEPDMDLDVSGALEEELEPMEAQLRAIWEQVQSGVEKDDFEEEPLMEVPKPEDLFEQEPLKESAVAESSPVEPVAEEPVEETKTAAEPMLGEPERKENRQPVQEAAETKEAATPEQRPVRTRRGTPQIYGMDDSHPYEGAQGVVRREVQAGQPVSPVAAETQELDVTQVKQERIRARQTEQPTAQQPTAQQPRTMRRRPADAGIGSAARPAEARPAAARPQREAANRETSNREASNRTANARPMNARAAAARPATQNVQRMPGQAPQKPNKTARIIKEAMKAVKNPLLILMTLLHTVYLASAIAAIFLRELSYGQMAKLLGLLPFPSQLSGYLSMFQTLMSKLDNGAVAINLAIRIPDVLFCLGLWILCITALAAKERMSGAGFRMMQIAVTLNMIAACISLLAVLVVSVTLVIASWSAGTQSLLIMSIATLVLTIVVTMAIIMYFFCFLASIKAMRLAVGSGEIYGNASGYVAVLHIILAFTAVVTILSGIINLEITSISGGAGQLLWMILFGIWMLGYRGKMAEYEG